MKARHTQIQNHRRNINPSDIQNQKKRILALVNSAKRSSLPTHVSVGDVIRMHNREYIVWMVNDSRAACVPISGQFTVVSPSESINISPNSKVPIVRQLGKEGLVAILSEDNKANSSVEEQNDNKTDSKMSKKKKESDGAAPQRASANNDKVKAALGKTPLSFAQICTKTGLTRGQVRYAFLDKLCKDGYAVKTEDGWRVKEGYDAAAEKAKKKEAEAKAPKKSDKPAAKSEKTPKSGKSESKKSEKKEKETKPAKEKETASVGHDDAEFDDQ